MKQIVALYLLFASLTYANPYPNPKKVTSPSIPSTLTFSEPVSLNPRSGTEVLRVEIDWKKDETYTLSRMFIEKSGTPALIQSAQRKDILGSYKATLQFSVNGIDQKLYASIGTGREFRQLVRTLSFRFPLPNKITSAIFSLEAEHPETGKTEVVLTQEIFYTQAQIIPDQSVKVTLLQKAKKEPSLKFNFYAEGFDSNGEERFLNAARKAISILQKYIPAADAFEFRAVFATSKVKLGKYADLGDLRIRDSYLGLYFPYWRKFGRWHDVVYPTSETKYRNALGQVDYDYPLALIDDNQYWGVGNYKELTAIPIDHYQFSYLLLHEFGHFMGLNEEYEGGGPTELEFAPGIHEPWSQNMTFHPKANELKWIKHTAPGIALPTSMEEYRRFGGSLKNPVGAYSGGYGDSAPQGKNYKPVRGCMMSNGGTFCPVCQDALTQVIELDSGT